MKQHETPFPKEKLYNFVESNGTLKNYLRSRVRHHNIHI